MFSGALTCPRRRLPQLPLFWSRTVIGTGATLSLLRRARAEATDELPELTGTTTVDIVRLRPGMVILRPVGWADELVAFSSDESGTRGSAFSGAGFAWPVVFRVLVVPGALFWVFIFFDRGILTFASPFFAPSAAAAPFSAVLSARTRLRESIEGNQ